MIQISKNYAQALAFKYIVPVSEVFELASISGSQRNLENLVNIHKNAEQSGYCPPVTSYVKV